MLCRGAGAGPAGPANAGPMFTPKSRNKRARSWNSNWAAAAQAVNARAAVASSAYYSAWLLRSQAAIATGAVMPQNRTRSDLRGPEIQKFPGGACPQTPLACALRTRVRLPCTVLSSQFPRRTSANELPSPLLCMVHSLLPCPPYPHTQDNAGVNASLKKKVMGYYEYLVGCCWFST